MLVSILLLLALPSVPSSSLSIGKTSTSSKEQLTSTLHPSNSEEASSSEGELHNVTLITGDSVLVRISKNGTILSISVHPADPTKLGPVSYTHLTLPTN